MFSTEAHTQVSAEVKDVYREINKASGQVGGYGHNGPVYGELTMGTFQKVVNYLREHLDFGPDSMFLDIGSGLGKPNFHVAMDPGVKFSFGIELEELRWKLSMHNLRHCFSKCPGLTTVEEKHQHPNVFFAQADITSVENFSPFTHIYSFDIGFPPDALVQIANAFNISRSVQVLVSFQRPNRIIDTYGFAVELVQKITTRMCGSSEGHTAYVYKSLFNASKPKAPKAAAPAPVTLTEDAVGPAGALELALEVSDEAPLGTRLSRRRTRSPVKRKRNQQLQMDKIFSATKRPRTSLRKAKLTPTGKDKAGPQVLFPTEKKLQQPSPLFQTGMDLLALRSSDSASPYPAWLAAEGLLTSEGRPKRERCPPTALAF